MFKRAIADILAGWRHRRLWMTLAREDISDQHRRTILGPLWILVNYSLFVGAFILIFGVNSNVENFVLYVATGWLVWSYFSDVIAISPSLFRQEASFIMGTALPLSVYVLKLTVQVLVRGGYAFIGWILIVLWSGWLPTWSGTAEAIAGTVLIIACTPPLIMTLAIVGSLFSDLQFILSNLLRVGMFLTPIFWAPTSERFQNLMAQWNPLAHFIDLIRSPLIYGYTRMDSLIVSVSMFILFNILAIFLLGKYRNTIVHTL